MLLAPFAGAVADAYAWYPDGYGWKGGIHAGTQILLSRPLLGIVREFLPGVGC